MGRRTTVHTRYRFTRAQRLSRAADIDAVKQTGRRVKAEHLDVRVAPSPLSFARVGIIVPKYKRSIVERNQLRRRMRELVRLKLLPVLCTEDVLIRVHPKAYAMTFDQLALAVDTLVDRLGSRPS